MHPGKIAHLWIMHKNYASFALEVVVDKYLMFFRIAPGWRNEMNLIPFHPNRHPSKPFSTAAYAFLILAQKRLTNILRMFILMNILRKRDIFKISRIENLFLLHIKRIQIIKLLFEHSLNPFLCCHHPTYGPRRILIRVHHCIVEQVINLHC